MSLHLSLWILGTHFFLFFFKLLVMWRVSVSVISCSLLSDILVTSKHTLCSIPGLHGQCCVQVQWATPVQWMNLRLWLFVFARSVLHSSCTDTHSWCTRLTDAIIITDVHSAILKLYTNFRHASFPLYC
jgi:hypothetical protein